MCLHLYLLIYQLWTYPLVYLDSQGLDIRSLWKMSSSLCHPFYLKVLIKFLEFYCFYFFLVVRCFFFYHIPNTFQFLVYVTCLEFLSSWRHFSWSLTINCLFLSRPCFDFWINGTISWSTYLPFSLSLSSLCWQIPSRRDVKMIFLNLYSTKIYFILPSHLIKDLAKESQVQNNFLQNIKGCFAVL